MIQGINNVAFNGGKDTLVKKAGITVKELAHDSYAATRKNIDMAKIQEEIQRSNSEYLQKVIGFSKSALTEELPKVETFADRANSYALSHGAAGLKLNKIG